MESDKTKKACYFPNLDWTWIIFYAEISIGTNATKRHYFDWYCVSTRGTWLSSSEDFREFSFWDSPSVIKWIDSIVALKQLSTHCNYSDYLSRDTCFVCGLKFNNKKCWTSFWMPLTTFEKGWQIARAMEMTETNGLECRPATSNGTYERQGMVDKVRFLITNL